MVKIKMKQKIPKKVKKSTKMLNNMFQQMLGLEAPKKEIILDKYINLLKKIIKYYKVYKLFINFNIFWNLFQEEQVNVKEQINNYLFELKKNIEEPLNKHISLYKEELEVSSKEPNMEDTLPTQTHDVDQFNINIDNKGIDNILEILEKCNNKEINNLYNKLKDCTEVKQIIITTSKLKDYVKYIKNRQNIVIGKSDRFIVKESSIELKLLDFCKLDLKFIWNSNKSNEIIKKYILNILSHTYEIGLDIYKIITSPNIDIRKFSKIIVDSIKNLKIQIPGCNKAFDIISNSINILENNFDTYYKDSMQSKNPSMIIEHFISDIAIQTKPNGNLTKQFKQIISFLQTNITKKMGKTKNKEMEKIFGILNKNIEIMEKKKYTKEDKEEMLKKTEDVFNTIYNKTKNDIKTEEDNIDTTQILEVEKPSEPVISHREPKSQNEEGAEQSLTRDTPKGRGIEDSRETSTRPLAPYINKVIDIIPPSSTSLPSTTHTPDVGETNEVNIVPSPSPPNIVLEKEPPELQTQTIKNNLEDDSYIII